jgi:hypothetical protein
MIPGIEGIYVYATGAKRNGDTPDSGFWPRFAIAAHRKYHNITLATVEDVLIAQEIAGQLAYLYGVPCEIMPSAQAVIDRGKV